jgi:23S rRNA (adenine2030-N6)-methyltransferase
MNYRHAFHAGNHADVLKHFVLSRLLMLLGRKDAPYAYLDSHSGIGLYDLFGDQASRTGEWQAGIGRLWAMSNCPEPLQTYLKVIHALNLEDELRFYPGSPEIARRLSRPQDRLHLNELHPEDGTLLKENMGQERRIAVHQRDGWLLPKALLPTQEKRALLLIDPPFEQADEFERCAAALKESIARMRQIVTTIWYPIKDQRQLKRFYQDLQKSQAPKLLRAELWVHPIDNPVGLNGSGLVISNPPWGLEDELRNVLPWLADHLGQSQAGWRLDWLIEE